MNKVTILLVLIICVNYSCKTDLKPQPPKVVKEKIIKQFGYTLNDYHVVKDTVKSGDSFGTILEKNNLFYPQIFNIVQKAKQVYDVRKINIGKPYTILFSKDSLKSPKLFVYQPNPIDYVLVSLTDSLWAEKKSKAVKLIEFEAQGTITSSLSETMEEEKLSPLLSNELSEIYAWTIDFFRLEKGDKFKIIYTGKFVDDSIYVGLNRIHSAFFEHRKTPFYAIEFETDPKRGIYEYFDENGKTDGYWSSAEVKDLSQDTGIPMSKMRGVISSLIQKDIVYIGDIHIVGQSEIELYVLNKPKGYITSKKDELDRKTVYDLLPKDKQHLISIGRLDFNTEGLLLFTNNGDYARYYELPKNKISRTYKVKVYGNIQNSYIKKIKDGITIDGITHNVDEITLEKKLNTNNWFIMKLTEGKNREIRKIFESLNLVVNRIIRTHYGKYSIVNMKLGEFKEVNAEKIKA